MGGLCGSPDALSRFLDGEGDPLSEAGNIIIVGRSDGLCGAGRALSVGTGTALSRAGVRLVRAEDVPLEAMFAPLAVAGAIVAAELGSLVRAFVGAIVGAARALRVVPTTLCRESTALGNANCPSGSGISSPLKP